jgi:DNA-binding MarR family transcriptional regulator
MVPDAAMVSLMEQFRAVAHRVHTRTNARMNAAGMSLARFRVLTVLHGSGRMRMNELSGALGVVPRTVTTIVDAMEEEGLLARLVDLTDRRATQLELTKEGVRQLRHLRITHDAVAAELFSALTKTERTQLARLLERLQAIDTDTDTATSHTTRY